jgi:hypothetical protein
MSTSGGAGAGEWAVEAEVTFPGNVTVRQAAPTYKVIAEITSIEWATHTVPEYAGELYDTGPGSGGSDIRMHPDAVSFTGPERRKVDVRVQVQPELLGIPIVLDWRDVDEASDHDGPIDADPAAPDPNKPNERPENGSDNLSHFLAPEPDLSPSATTDSSGQVRVVFDIGAIQPGNNFRVIAGARQADLDRVLAKSADSASEVFYDENDNGVWNAGEVTLDDEISIEGCVATRVLTIWRYLYVEVDSMGAPPPGTKFPDDDIPNDVEVADVPAPNTTILYSAFLPACVEVVLGTAFDESNVHFLYHLETDDTTVDHGEDFRGLDSAPAYWAVYVQGAYDGPIDHDADPDPADYRTGMTANGMYSFTFTEVIRDICEAYNWDESVVGRRTTAHEIAEQFNVPHDTVAGYIMWPNADPAMKGDTFSEQSLKMIREAELP